jgi:hypothetical protein
MLPLPDGLMVGASTGTTAKGCRSPFLLLAALLCLLAPSATPFMYRPAHGLTWDPSCMIYENKTYCYFMYACNTRMAGCPSGANDTFRGGQCTQNPAAPGCFYFGFGHGLLATAHDGVHFTTHGVINAETNQTGWCKPQVAKVDDVDGNAQFVMNHGTAGAASDCTLCTASNCTQCLRFLRSSDLYTWELMYTAHPDWRWYLNQHTRWDAAYMLEDPAGGYAAFSTATPIGHKGLPGQLRSPDGLNWTATKPPVFDFGGVSETAFETGGVERLGDRFYMILGGSLTHGSNYNQWTFRSHGADINGPYSPDPDAYRLSGQSKDTSFAAPGLSDFVHDFDQAGGTLVTQYFSMPHTPDCGLQKNLFGGGHVWLLPFRQPVVDAGHLRLGHWSGNDALKGPPLAISSNQSAFVVTDKDDHAAGPGVGTVFLSGSDGWDHSTGVIVTGVLQATAATKHVGFALSTVADTTRGNGGGDPTPTGRNATVTTSILMDVSPDSNLTRATRVIDFANTETDAPLASGRSMLSPPPPPPSAPRVRDVIAQFQCGGNSSKPVMCQPASPTGVAPGSHPFLMYCRHGIFELYVGSPLLLVQTLTYGEYPVKMGRIGFAAVGGASFRQLSAWEMSLAL